MRLVQFHGAQALQVADSPDHHMIVGNELHLGQFAVTCQCGWSQTLPYWSLMGGEVDASDKLLQIASVHEKELLRAQQNPSISELITWGWFDAEASA